jgi:hypothetical protein
VLYHFFIWTLFTSKLLAPPVDHHIGDLARIGYQIPSAYLRKNEITLSKKHIDAKDYTNQDIDIITLGDSFSNADMKGKNPYYQDYISSTTGLDVLNAHKSPKVKNDIETVMLWYNSGLLDIIRPKAILIESVERLAVSRYAQNINWSITTNIKEAREDLINSTWPAPAEIQTYLFINSGNYNYIIYNTLYNFSSNAFNKSKVFKFKLDRNVFSVDSPSTLLVYKEDIQSLDSNNKENLELLNHNFNQLAQYLNEKDIKLYVMIATDKYDLYSPYMISNPHKENLFFNHLRPLNKEYIFIDTKKMLSPLLKQNGKDIYYADDTHWSYKASEHIISEVFQ